MKKLKYVLLINFTISILLYLIKSFITWTLTNPLMDIINIGGYSELERAAFLFLFAFCFGMTIAFISILKKTNKLE